LQYVVFKAMGAFLTFFFSNPSVVWERENSSGTTHIPT